MRWKIYKMKKQLKENGKTGKELDINNRLGKCTPMIFWKISLRIFVSVSKIKQRLILRGLNLLLKIRCSFSSPQRCN